MNFDNKSDDLLDNSNPSHVAQFRLHQEFVQAHLKGASNDEQPLLPAFFPPSSYWTSHEKDLFFHGLASYSRFRPDLIAESIKTKTTFDVCLYLDILQTASSGIPSQTHGSFRSSLEPAMEVSDTWIQNEEETAAALIQLDSCTWTRRSADREAKNPENICVCSPQSLLIIDCHTRPSPVDHSNHTELKKSFLSHLDCTCLMALEKIVDSAPVPSSPSASFGQLATQTNSSIEEGLFNSNSPKSPVIVSSIMEIPEKPDTSKSEDRYLLMKRLYMRRKRAQSAGGSANMEAIRLRPGRQIRDGKPSRPSRPRPKIYKSKQKITLFNSSEKPETTPEADRVVSVPTPVDEMDQEEEPQHEPQSKGGLKDRFLEIGISPQLASKNNLDFFHLSSLVRLMKLYGSLNDLTRPQYKVSISADTIQLLVTVLKEFVSEVVHSCVISKEQEIRLKGVTKVWKYEREEISVENVKKTLESMGIAHSNVKDYFAELVAEGSDGISSPDPSIGAEVESNDDNNGDGKGDDNRDDVYETSNEDIVVDPGNTSDVSEYSSTPSQALAELWLPESFRRCLLAEYTRVSDNDGDFLPEIDEIDEIGLQRELAEEEELNARDLMVSKEFEVGLWGS